MVCAPISWEGNQSFPPRKSASLNGKNKSSFVLSNGHLHHLKIWVTSFSCWEVGIPGGRGGLYIFSAPNTAELDSVCSAACWPPCPSSVLTIVTWQPVGRCPCCCLFCGTSDHDSSSLPVVLLPSSRPPTSIHSGQPPGLLLPSAGQSAPANLLPLWPVGKHLLSFMAGPWNSFRAPKRIYIEYKPNA